MRKTMEYKAPEIEVTRFEVERNIMAGIGENEKGPQDTVNVTGTGESVTDPDDLPLPIG